MNSIIQGMLEDLPADRRAFWLDQVRGVDTRARALYDGRKLQKPHNETNQPSGNS